MTYTQPLILFFSLIAFSGLITIGGHKRRVLTFAGLLGLLLVSWPPVDWLLSRPLEARYPVRPLEAFQDIQAIAVLASAVLPANFVRPYALADEETFQRCQYAAWLYTHWKRLPVLACAGRMKGSAGAIRTLLQQAGVPENMIWVENRSQTTHENALYGAQILREHGISKIALVVDAQSMFRAEACFRKYGIAVTPAPSRFRELDPGLSSLLPSWKAIRNNENTLHEMIGLGWYWVHGWI